MVYSDCPICLSGSEDIKHMMFMCDWAKSVWQLLLFFGKKHLLFLSNLPSPLFLPPFLSSMFGKQLLFFLHIFLSMFVKQLLLFFAKSPISSPLLCFADDEIIQVYTLYGIWADDQELVRNLTSLPATPTLPSPIFFVMMPWCSKFMIKWWLIYFWGLYYCYYSFLYIVVL